MKSGKSKFTSEKYSFFENAECAVRTFAFDNFEGGVRLCQNGGTDSSVLMINMIGEDGRLCSLPEPAEIEVETSVAQDLTALGTAEIKKHCRGDGADLFIVDASIIIRLASGTVISYKDKLSESMQAVFFCEGAFYISDGSILYKIAAQDGSISKTSPKIPLIYKNLPETGTVTGAMNEMVSIFTDYISFSYDSAATSFFTTPQNISVEMSGIKVKAPDGRYLSDSEFTVTTVSGNVCVQLVTQATTGGYTLYCKLGTTNKYISMAKLKAARERFCNMDSYMVDGISEGSYNAVLCGYGSSLYTRTLLLYRMDTNSLYVPFDKYSMISLPYKVSGLLPYYGGYLTLTEHAVYQLNIGTDGTAETSTVTLLKSDFGCDMPGSAVAFDNKIVFGNSKRGIFCFDKYGIGERDTNKKISANIEWGEHGFFSCTETERKNAKADFCGGLYVLAVGVKTYIWNFFAHAPSTASDSEKNEKAHVWYLRTDMDVREILSSAGDAIYYIPSDSARPMCALMKHSSVNASSHLYSSITSDLAAPGKEKIVTGIRIYARSGGDFKISLRYDGVSSPDVYTAENSGDYGTIKEYHIRPFRRRFNYFCFELSSESPLALDKVMIDYICIK